MIVKMAVVLDKQDYTNIAEKHIVLFAKADKSKLIVTPDNEYVVVYWEFPNVDDILIRNLTEDLKSIRHSYIEITEDDVLTDVETCDDRGCDEEFYDLIGWKADICIGQDEHDVL